MRRGLTLCKAAARETRPDQNNANYVPCYFGQVCGFFNGHNVEGDGATVYSS